MKNLKIEIVSVSVAMILALTYIFFPGPYTMFSFVFIGQPLIFYSAVSVGIQIYKDLKANRVL
ncbi:MAG: hypothetical protein A3H98_11960 [Bacteroidetes bacterium RIFCSPLOWO2_02_FULL_36_8]|nr:MAG: hypothetical protein A3H98_11960 [Bacteroidetes bacterium RIFCSPLOWO2_02_FULL_36_8]OFY69570.1 MAG: hypothetical protein A3G23_11070 [Bacteroidetes bacterium RIFCSPLOWO2_12_FULL_37_12]